jgi:hypothetical protein
MAGVRCRAEEDHVLVWMQERAERTRKYPEKLSKLEEDDKMKWRARLDMMTSNEGAPWTVSTVVRPIP